MFNTSFSNKTQLKIKNNFFYFTGSDPVQCIFSFWPDPVWPEQWSMTTLFMWFLRAISSKELLSCAFGKPAIHSQFMVGSTKIKLCFLLNQTTISVAAGELHPQPQYQTATYIKPLESCLNMILSGKHVQRKKIKGKKEISQVSLVQPVKSMTLIMDSNGSN